MQAALLYYRGSGIAAWWIRRWTKSRFAHVAPAIFFDDSGGALAYDAYWSTGVTKRELYPVDLWFGVEDVQYLPFDAAQVDAKLAWLEEQVDKHYDKPSIVIIGLTKRLPGWLHVYVSRQGEWICSLLAMVTSETEQECWGLNGPPSPEDIHRITKAKYEL